MEKKCSIFATHFQSSALNSIFSFLLIRMWLKSALQESFSSQFIVNRPTTICTRERRRASAEYWESRAIRSWKSLSFFFSLLFCVLRGKFQFLTRCCVFSCVVFRGWQWHVETELQILAGFDRISVKNSQVLVWQWRKLFSSSPKKGAH